MLHEFLLTLFGLAYTLILSGDIQKYALEFKNVPAEVYLKISDKKSILLTIEFNLDNYNQSEHFKKHSDACIYLNSFNKKSAQNFRLVIQRLKFDFISKLRTNENSQRINKRQVFPAIAGIITGFLIKNYESSVSDKIQNKVSAELQTKFKSFTCSRDFIFKRELEIEYEIMFQSILDAMYSEIVDVLNDLNEGKIIDQLKLSFLRFCEKFNSAIVCNNILLSQNLVEYFFPHITLDNNFMITVSLNCYKYKIIQGNHLNIKFPVMNFKNFFYEILYEPKIFRTKSNNFDLKNCFELINRKLICNELFLAQKYTNIVVQKIFDAKKIDLYQNFSIINNETTIILSVKNSVQLFCEKQNHARLRNLSSGHYILNSFEQFNIIDKTITHYHKHENLSTTNHFIFENFDSILKLNESDVITELLQELDKFQSVDSNVSNSRILPVILLITLILITTIFFMIFFKKIKLYLKKYPKKRTLENEPVEALRESSEAIF